MDLKSDPEVSKLRDHRINQAVLKGQLQTIRIHGVVWLGGTENKVPDRIV